MGGSHYLNYAGGGTNFDFFHIGALLVVIMAIVTGIVLCVAVVGVCCFHWLDDYQDKRKTNPHSHSDRNTNCSGGGGGRGVMSNNRDVLRNSFIRNHIIRFEHQQGPYPPTKVFPDAPANIDLEPPPAYSELFPQTQPVLVVSSGTNNVQDVSIRDASTRL